MINIRLQKLCDRKLIAHFQLLEHLLGLWLVREKTNNQKVNYNTN